MDKYTVDLDKVLNDFEYSELTDQYNIGGTLQLNNTQTSLTHRQDLYKIKPAPVKHTINNVFQSLNEYLNTDIGVKNKQTEPSSSNIINSDNNVPLTYDEPDDQPLNNEQAPEEFEVEILPLEVPKISEETPCTESVIENIIQSENIQDEGIQIEDAVEVENIVQEENVIHVKQQEENEDKNEEVEEEEDDDKTSIEDDMDSTDLVEVKEPEVCTPQVLILQSNETEVVSFETNIVVDDSELHRYLDDLENELETEDNNGQLRPNTLQISNNSAKIDLIGEPGSTPYNNMYSSKMLPSTEGIPESNTESSLSMSPTFSDISNDSTATTESVTDSIDEKKSLKVSDDQIDVNIVDNVENEAVIEDLEVENDETVTQTDESDEPVVHVEETSVTTTSEQNLGIGNWLGKQAPLWIPDSDALNCLHCDTKFTVIKRRHHCRACGLVLCSKCCNMKYKLEYLDTEARVCLKCHDILNRDTNSSSGSEVSPASGNSPNRQLNQPNPNNPMEYCSMIPPLQQVASARQNPPSVMVPVGVLKRKGSTKTRINKSVMFCDGIRPGSELTNLDNDFNYSEPNRKRDLLPSVPKQNRNAPVVDVTTKSFIPTDENSLPPTITIYKSDVKYTECANNMSVVEMLKNEPLTFALQSNLHVHVKIINMDCCINKCAWCFSTEGMITVGQDEIILLIEFDENDKVVLKDIFFHLNDIYSDAKKGSSITENGISLHNMPNFLGSKNHIGFLYIRPTFQCLQNVLIPKEPYLIGILIHRWEMPWAKIFPLRLTLRLGAEYRYYPSPIISTRHRESVFVEIGHTIINLLADFRNFSYTLPNIRGLTIHMEDKNTTVTIPLNRYDQVMKSLNNSSDHILAFGGNFSIKADSHLVCIQDTQGNNENTYTTHAINIHNRPRKVTGASFIVFNGALKSSSGLTAKSSIVEDGLMIQIPSEQMQHVRESLRNMKSHTIQCGCINTTSDETVNIVWGENDIDFNVGVCSSIDNQSLSGIPSIRVHNGKDYLCNSGNRMIRWTEVFILQNGEDNARGQDVNFSKLAESISKATCQALVKYLDLLSSNNFCKIGIRATLHMENVSYSAGSNGMKLPPIYMKSLDNELVPVLHRITSSNMNENVIVLELVFHILNA